MTAAPIRSVTTTAPIAAALVAMANVAGCSDGSAPTPASTEDFLAVCQRQSDLAQAGTTAAGRIAISCPAPTESAATYTAALSGTTPPVRPSAGSINVANLFRSICMPHEGNFIAAVTAANASKAFRPAATNTTGSGGARSVFTSNDGTTEAIIVTGDPLGDSCGIGNLRELYIIGPGLRFLPSSQRPDV